MLYEREPELARIDTAVRRAQAGRASALLLAGPVGIGRSALLQEAGDHPPGALRVLRANAASMEQDFAFGVVHQLLGPLLAGDLTVPADAGGAARPDPTGGLPAPGDEDAAGSEVVLHRLRSLLAEACATTPVLLLVDDLQWADLPSLRWLAYLARRPHGLRAVLVCTLRDGDPRAQHPLIRGIADAADILRPGPVSLDSTRALIHHHFGEPADDSYAHACHDTCAGNPLFLRSVLRDLALSGHRPTAEHAEQARVRRPAQLRDRLAGCLHTQPGPVRDLATALAAFGDHGEPDLIRRHARLDTTGYRQALRTLHHLGLLGPVPGAAESGEGLPAQDPAAQDTPRFLHRVVRDAVESALTVAERERSRYAAAELLHQAGHPAEHVADLLMAVTATHRPWAVEVLRAAAEAALRRGEPGLAARRLQRALLESTAGDGERARLLIELAGAERGIDRAACERHISQAVRLLPSATDRAAAALRIPPSFLGEAPPSGVDLLRRASEDLDPTAPHQGCAREIVLRLEARLWHAGHENPTELTGAVERLRALGSPPPLDTGGARELAAVLTNAAVLSSALPAPDVAALAERILEREPVTAARAGTALPLVAVAQYAADAVEGIHARLSCERHSDGSHAVVHAEHALMQLACGRLVQAREQGDRAAELADADWREPTAVVRAAVAMETGDIQLIESLLEDAGKRWPDSLALTAMLQLLKASLDARRGRGAHALRSLLACGRQLEAAGWRNSALYPWRPRAIVLHHRLGEARQARALAEEELAWARQWAAPAALGRALRLKALLPGGGGVPALRESAEILRTSANTLELARTLLQLGRAMEGGKESRAVLREAADLTTACGAPWLTERACAALGTTAPSVEAPLTHSERKVVSLVGRGLTNQEIADELGVSTRAVEKHLTSCYRKLGVVGRRELLGGRSSGRAFAAR
ncbi:LuxR family transcriptional regulator [Streptomyces sp. NBRC 110611]|uniref:helix-turn-helix transcriptional regulator n=1 Tax=Streptomyces sp. NBRC 110611 TaxID=1621259 RepID=UPI0008347143|nr:LuxR family transcriptional regulator [Streptomyces sp. NBRC 110611]GAU69350.1 LuxR family transcriptional regulator [Streptomyces sp. NBRC 110611]